jgi:hypothetical protein
MLDRLLGSLKPTSSGAFELVAFAFVDHVSTLLLLLLLLSVIMSSTEPTTEVLECLFLAPDAPLGAAWLQSTIIPLSHDLLHHLVLTSKIPSIIQARSSYGYFRTASQMHKVSGLHCPSESGLNAALQQEPLCLNPQPVSLLKNMWYYVSTALGILETSYSNADESPAHHHQYGSKYVPYCLIVIINAAMEQITACRTGPSNSKQA